MKPIRLGLVGAAGRGSSFLDICKAIGGIEIQAVCDIRADQLPRIQAESGAKQAFADYQDMLRLGDIDAVLIATPMPFHAEQSIAALDSGRHVLCEVTACTSTDEAKRLVAAVKRSDRIYTMAENYLYTASNVLITELVRQGCFGEVYQAEAEYLHELKGLIETTPWRRHWQAGLPGITYPTHSLGPVLDWMPGDRVARLTCGDSGSHYSDPRGEPYHHDSATMLAKTVQGRLITLRFDIISDRPHAMNNYQLQGTDGAYESGRADNEWGRLWCRSMHREMAWSDPRSLLQQTDTAARYLPAWYRDNLECANRSGHGGGDFFEVLQFVRTLRGEIANPVDIHRALDMTLPGLISQDPLAGERWLAVPDSRTW